MARRTTRSRGMSAARTGDTPPSISDEMMTRSDPGELFADGVKIRDTECVGAMTPDTDPLEPESPLDAASRRRPLRPVA
jgi:hypothetical protein